MGLDMFFYASKPGTTMKQAIDRERELNELDYDEWRAVRESDGYPTLEMGYLRKANQVFNWIEREVADIGNCEPLQMTKRDVQLLEATVYVTLKYPGTARRLLPTREGFFFGDTGYGESYFADLEETERICARILDEVDFDNQDVWFYAWW